MTSYGELSKRLHADGEDYMGAFLRRTLMEAEAVCAVCGPLPPLFKWGWSSEWITMAGYARDHSRDTGHYVAVRLEHLALYGKDEDDGDEPGRDDSS